MKCPNCGSENIQYVSDTSGGGLSCLRSCCGLVALGPLGRLCGIKGSHTDEFWICKDCGNRFSNGAAIRNQEREELAAERQANAEKKAIGESEQYKNYKKSVSAAEKSAGSEAAIHEQYSKARSYRIEEEKEYNQCLHDLRRSADRKTRRYAKKALNKIRARWILILAAIPVTLFVDVIIGPALAVIGIIYGGIASTQKENAERALIDKYPEFKEQRDTYQEALKEEHRLWEILQQLDYIKDYEKKHRD